ncbi:MAG: hypothetical protein Q9178_004440 [Gyalolechia marmorata]
MGQRHQLFVIARINGRYRQLAAIHHQWLYGHTALRRCRDTLNIFGNKTNRIPLQQELIAASQKDDDFWLAAHDDPHKNEHVPFPFIMTCLVTGTSFNLDGYYHGVLVEPFYMAYDEGDNNNGKSFAYMSTSSPPLPTRHVICIGTAYALTDSRGTRWLKGSLNSTDILFAGITVFDITTPDNPRYCFVDFMGMESEREVDLHTPLSARTYLEAYYELDNTTHNEVGLLPLVESFQSRSLITKEALAETWPNGAWEYQSPSNVDSTDPPDLEGLDNADKLKSLRTLAMDRLLEMLLDPSEQDIQSLLAEADHLNDFVPNLRRRLYNKASTLEPSATNIGLLQKALEGVTTVDLSLFKLWSAEHLSAVLSQLRTGVDGVKVLNMSNMPDLTEPELAAIMKLEDGKTTSHINTIIILETPKISLGFVAKYFGKHDVYHSELFRRALHTPYSHFESPLLPALQFDAPAISQLVWVGISVRQCWYTRLRLQDGHYNWNTLKFSTSVERNCDDEDQCITYTTFMLDIPLPIAKTIQSLRRLLQYMPAVNTYPYEDVFMAAARCFTTTSVLDDDGYSIGPLSQSLLEDRRSHRGSETAGSGKNQYLKPGHWTIILIHEAFDAVNQNSVDRGKASYAAEDMVPASKPEKRFRYMLAQATTDASNSGPRFLTVDVPTYIDSVLKDDADQIQTMKKWWAKETADVTNGMSYYDEQDAHAILDRVYSKEGFGKVDTGANSD